MSFTTFSSLDFDWLRFWPRTNSIIRFYDDIVRSCFLETFDAVSPRWWIVTRVVNISERRRVHFVTNVITFKDTVVRLSRGRLKKIPEKINWISSILCNIFKRSNNWNVKTKIEREKNELELIWVCHRQASGICLFSFCLYDAAYLLKTQINLILIIYFI